MDEEQKDPCEVCGRPARVRVLEKYKDGKPVFRSYCLDCADTPRVPDDENTGVRHHLSVGSLMILAGLIVAFLGGAGDYLGIRNPGGVGWYQMSGLGVGALLVVLGAILGVDLIALVGTFVFGLSACSDVLGLGDNPGIGPMQNLALVGGTLLIAVGVVVRWRFGRAG